MLFAKHFWVWSRPQEALVWPDKAASCLFAARADVVVRLEPERARLLRVCHRERATVRHPPARAGHERSREAAAGVERSDRWADHVQSAQGFVEESKAGADGFVSLFYKSFYSTVFFNNLVQRCLRIGSVTLFLCLRQDDCLRSIWDKLNCFKAFFVRIVLKLFASETHDVYNQRFQRRTNRNLPTRHVFRWVLRSSDVELVFFSTFCINRFTAWSANWSRTTKKRPSNWTTCSCHASPAPSLTMATTSHPRTSRARCSCSCRCWTCETISGRYGSERVSFRYLRFHSPSGVCESHVIDIILFATVLPPDVVLNYSWTSWHT